MLNHCPDLPPRIAGFGSQSSASSPWSRRRTRTRPYAIAPRSCAGARDLLQGRPPALRALFRLEAAMEGPRRLRRGDGAVPADRAVDFPGLARELEPVAKLDEPDDRAVRARRRRELGASEPVAAGR